MSRLLLKSFVVAAFLTTLLAPIGQAHAYDPLAASCADPAGATSAVCQSGDGDPLTGPDGLIPKITLIIAIIAGVASVIVMALGGIRYITSAGAPDQVAQAKKTIIFAAVGLIVVALSQSLIMFIIGRI